MGLDKVIYYYTCDIYISLINIEPSFLDSIPKTYTYKYYKVTKTAENAKNYQ